MDKKLKTELIGEVVHVFLNDKSFHGKVTGFYEKDKTYIELKVMLPLEDINRISLI